MSAGVTDTIEASVDAGPGGASAKAPDSEHRDDRPAEPTVMARREPRANRAPEWAAQLDLAAFQPEPEWRTAQRRAAIERFVALGFPTTKNEDWHFTNPAPITEQRFTPVTRPGRAPATLLADAAFGGEWDTLVFVDGHVAASETSVAHAVDGIYVGTLAGALADPRHADVVARELGALATAQGHAFTELNAAFQQDGACVIVPANTVLPRRLHVIYVAATDGGLVSPRSLFVLGRHAQATVVESFVSSDATVSFTNAVSEAVLKDGARLTMYKVQREGVSAYHVASAYVLQERDSHLEAFSFATGAELSRTNVGTVLHGTGAHATLNGLYMVNGTQTVDHQTRIEHAAESCTSHEVYKGVLDGRSHAVFNGKVYVQPEAQKTDGKQSNNNLLLSEGAHVDTKPQLEIFADDVKCTHGATIGRLDPTALFYLKSRGVGEQTARKLLTYAFAAEVLEELTVDPVRESLEEQAFARFAR